MDKSMIRNIALIVVFLAVPVVLFMENVRPVQIVGLMVCGAVIGIQLREIVYALKNKAGKA